MGRGKCGRARCFPCLGSKGGNCWREEVTYSLWCEECGEKVAAYQGETGRNGFTRGREHLENLEAKNEDKSVLWLHSIFHHQRREDVHEGYWGVQGLTGPPGDGEGPHLQLERAGQNEPKERYVRSEGRES